jgi:hypothetical protein
MIKEQMNIPPLLISIACLIGTSILAYEAWLAPKKLAASLSRNRKFIRSFLGFSSWKENKMNLPLIKTLSILGILGSVLGIIFSITGPIIYYR